MKATGHNSELSGDPSLQKEKSVSWEPVGLMGGILVLDQLPPGWNTGGEEGATWSCSEDPEDSAEGPSVPHVSLPVRTQTSQVVPRSRLHSKCQALAQKLTYQVSGFKEEMSHVAQWLAFHP